MATQPTNLPVPSESPRDLKFNAGKIDEFVTSLVNTYIDRFGNEHYTIEGLRWLAQQAISSFGWIPIGTFQAGATLTLPNQILKDETDGEYYRWDGDFPKEVPVGSSPESTGGIGSGVWIGVGDSALRGMLASSADPSYGDAMIAVMQPVSGSVPRTQHDKNYDSINICDFGAKCDGVTDDTAAIQAAFASGLGTNIVRINFPMGRKVKISGTILVPQKVQCDFNGCTLIGDNTVTMFQSARFIDGVLTSNLSEPVGSENFLFDLRMENALILDSDIVFNMYYVTANCSFKNIRTFGANQLMNAKECFYCSFEELTAWSPTVASRPAFYWDGDIQAQGVRKCFAGSGFAVGHRIKGFNDVDCFDTCGAEGCTTGVFLTGGTGESGGLQNIEFHNWYFEGNGRAVYADPAYNYQQVNFRNCFWSLNDVHIDGETIYSGSIDESNVFNDSTEHPGYFRLGNINNGRNGFTIKLRRQWGISNVTYPTIDTSTKYIVGQNVLLERDITYAHPTTSGPVAKTTERYGIAKRDCWGSSVGVIPSGVVPFCGVSINGLSVSVTTKIAARTHEMIAFSLQAETSGGPSLVCGTVINGIVMQPAGQRPVTISTSAGGNYILTFSTVSSTITSCSGIVRII